MELLATNADRRRDRIGALTVEQEFALLHRMLWHEGYNDRIAGHITMRDGEDCLLSTPYGLGWDEVRASDVIRINHRGELLSGDWLPTPAIALHVAVHALRPDAVVAIHHHPRWALAWASARRIPPIYDQLGSFEVDDLVLYDEYLEGVATLEIAERNVLALNGAKQALLAHHGVLVIGSSVPDAHQRAVVLEHRCRTAADVEALGGTTPLDPTAASATAERIRIKGGWPSFWVSMATREINRDESVLS